MKRYNKSVVLNDNALSAIIGLILMIAIVVSIAATVYIVTSNISSKKVEQSNMIGFDIDDANDKFSVINSMKKANWSSIKIKANNPTWVTAKGNSAEVTSDYQLVSSLFNISGMIEAGDTFIVSTNSTGEKMFSFIYGDSNTIAAIVNLNL